MDDFLLYWDGQVNLGDQLAPIIYKWMLNRNGLDATTTPKEETLQTYKYLATIGSIIGLKKGSEIIWGSGILSDNLLISGVLPNINGYPLDIRAVRGPLTAGILRRLGFSVPECYGDPGVLLPYIYQPQNIEKKYDISLICHHEHQLGTNDFHKIYIDTNDYKFFIDEIVASKMVISSSLHGIILSETYGIPTIWLNHVPDQSLKYLDWYYSTNRTNIRSISSLDEVKTVKPMKLPNLIDMQMRLFASFPYDIY